MTTYSGFLIHDNLRAYIDRNGKLEPKFIHQEFKTLDEAKAKIDLYWDEWQQWESRRQVNYAKSLAILTDDTDRSDEARENEAQDFEDKVNAYYERENFQHD